MLTLNIRCWTDTPPTSLSLADNAVDVWWANLDTFIHAAQAYRALLDPSETVRLERFLLERLRLGFIVRRGLLRCLLAAYLNCQPAAIRYSIEQNGKLALSFPPVERALHFNLSHSGSYATFAVTRAGAVGVDIERAAAFKNMLQVARTVFSESEQAELAGLPADQQVTAFYSGWTRKEAVVKALGHGISFPLQTFSVSLRSDAPVQVPVSQDARLDACKLFNIPLPATLIAACAVLLP